MRLPDPIRGDAEFFRAFARFEEVLKAVGYFRPLDQKRIERSYDAFPDWEQFAHAKKKELQDLLDVARSREESRYLVENPPRKEIIVEGQLSWEEERAELRSVEELLQAVKRVRNNLFHGAKSVRPPSGDYTRNERLIGAAMAVLCEVLRRCPDLEAKYDDYGW